MGQPFEPKRKDGRALWRVLFDDIVGRIKSGALAIDGLVTHDEMKKLLSVDEEKNYYAAMLRATRQLEQELHRTLEQDRGRGYRLRGGMGHAERSVAYKDRGHRNFTRALTVASTVDHKLLSAADSAVIDRQTRALGALLFIAKQHDDTLNAHAEQMREIRQQVSMSKSRHSATDDEVAELKRRLAALENKTAA
jgi:hypothetical protein